MGCNPPTCEERRSGLCEAGQCNLVTDLLKSQHDIHIEGHFIRRATRKGAYHAGALLQLDQDYGVGSVSLEGGAGRAMNDAERMDLAAAAGCAVHKTFAATGAAGRLLVILHMAAIGTVLQQQLAVLQAAPERRRVGVRCREWFAGGVFSRDHSVFLVPRMVVALVAKPAPRLCTSPSSALGTCRSPHSPRNWATTSWKWNSDPG